MGSVNSVFIMGNLTRDPELRRTKDGTAVADLGVAVSERYRNKEGKEMKAVCFTDVVVWGRPGEACAQYLRKGAPVMVEGRLQFDQWESSKGEKRSKLRVRAHSVQFLGGGKNGEKPGGAADEGAVVREEDGEDPFL